MHTKLSKILNTSPKLLPLVFFCFCYTATIAQDEDRKEYNINTHSKNILMYLEADYQSRKTHDPSQYVFRKLSIFDRSEDKDKTKVAKSLTNEFGGKGSYIFSEVYDSFNKSFILILGEYCFYVYDMKTFKLSAPLKPRFWGQLTDSTRGNITEIHINKEGNYIYGESSGGGTFLYETCNPAFAQEINSANPPFFSESRFYELQNCENKTTTTGIMLNASDDGIVKEIFFENKKIKPTKKKIYNQLTENEIGEIIVAYTLEDAQYVILQETNDNFIVIDSWAGEIVDISQMKQNKDRKSILKYLHQQNIIPQ